MSKLQVFWGTGFVWGALCYWAVTRQEPWAYIAMIVSAIPVGFGMGTLQGRWFK